MGILSFSKARVGRANHRVGDWSQQEIANFYRAHRLLTQNGVSIGMTCGLTDENDPWVVFYDDGSQDVFLHIARVSESCLLICETLDLHLEADDIATLIEKFENAVRDHLDVSSENAKGVSVHPASRIIMSISAVFLIFKLENQEAFASSAIPADVAELEETNPDNHKQELKQTSERSDVLLISNRAQSAAVRIFEKIDTPATIAVLASIVLLSELTSTHTIAEAKPKKIENTSFLKGSQNDATPVVATLELENSNSSEWDTATVGSFNENNGHKQNVVNVDLNKITIGDTFEKNGFDILAEIAVVDVNLHAENAPKNSRMIEDVRNEIILDTSGADLGQGESVTTYDDMANVVKNIFVAAKETTIVFAEREPQDFAASFPKNNEPLSDAADNSIGEISLANLDKIKNEVGFYLETNYLGSQLIEALKYFAAEIHSYEIEFHNGRMILVEDSLSEQLDAANVGLWSNKMDNGITMSVVGRAELIDDVFNFFV